MSKIEAKSDQNVHDEDEIDNTLTNVGSANKDDKHLGKFEQALSINGTTSQMQSNRKKSAKEEQSGDQEGFTRVIHFREAVHVDLPNSPKTISDSSKSEKRACRICQSETGELVRPCACTGTFTV
ncbi:unnamed protein product [Onchocerca flexuosa]|uniref:RING-CH-type domain-containing protein n=1 Tax=Onchocerca flexuosa TaxID=387005 RepID=A0A183I3X1_9BILA|nr:unnamed protein product [Onchocerca flexuosa]